MLAIHSEGRRASHVLQSRGGDVLGPAQIG